MLESIYIVMLLVDIALIIIGLTNCLNLTHHSRRLIMIIALVVTIPLMVSSYTIEEKYCVYLLDSSAFTCTIEVYQDLTMVLITIMFMLITMTYLILDFIGRVGQIENKE